MPSLHQSVSVLVVGFALGALSWFAAAAASGSFEPYDSGVGLMVNQAVLSAPVALLAWRGRSGLSLLLLCGAYLGMNAYAYGFGSSETRSWATLGAVVSMLLMLAPILLMLGAVAIRRFFRRN